ncbi:hypothetical protein B0H11DRAFT_2136509 [Mycena galericulata]|nr:hypothetical protein B0H11DRAFT_2136509 [Mycena galericulata]
MQATFGDAVRLRWSTCVLSPSMSLAAPIFFSLFSYFLACHFLISSHFPPHAPELTLFPVEHHNFWSVALGVLESRNAYAHFGWLQPPAPAPVPQRFSAAAPAAAPLPMRVSPYRHFRSLAVSCLPCRINAPKPRMVAPGPHRRMPRTCGAPPDVLLRRVSTRRGARAEAVSTQRRAGTGGAGAAGRAVDECGAGGGVQCAGRCGARCRGGDEGRGGDEQTRAGDTRNGLAESAKPVTCP